MKPRILIIRGGAIGDFILTLPALGLLREAFPNAHIEIIGYRHIVALAEGRYYADSARSIEYAAMAGFFARNGTLDDELQEYFAGFQQVVSYLFDPDGIFEANLARCGVKNFINAYVRIDDSMHAAEQLARPLESLALYLDCAAPVVHPTGEDRSIAEAIWPAAEGDFVAIHPGSGSPRKNWPIERWRQLIDRLIVDRRNILIVGGEADSQVTAALGSAFTGQVRVLNDLPLPALGALLARSNVFFGHDSGISHLAAAVGARCVLLFGPTDPAIWAPANPGVRVLAAPDGDLSRIDLAEVIAALP